jgi:hypothetical protein
MQQHLYSSTLAHLEAETAKLAEAFPVLEQAAAERGQRESLERAKRLAEALAIELAELRVTEAARNVRGWLGRPGSFLAAA